MKKKFKPNGFSVINILVLMLVFLQNTTVNAQVLTRVLGSEESLDSYLPFQLRDEPIMYLQPKLDFERVLNEDEKTGRQIPRFAVGYDVSYSTIDGIWSDLEKYSVWKIGFNATNASSLQFMMEELQIPLDAEMYIYSDESKMIQGPITMGAVTRGIFTSDVIERTGRVQIAVICKPEHINLHLKITKIAQGIPKRGSRAWGDAANCHFDVNCAIGNNWTMQRDAVGMVFANMDGHCSGALINNQCQDLAPNFLTAFHCVTGANVNNWVFRFNWQSLAPNCPGNTGGPQPYPSTWVTRNGATLRASSAATDFALLLLNGGGIGVNPIEANLALAGWNRANQAPTSTTIIHHPAGDAKKITFDFNPAQQQVFNGAQCWFLQTDLGSTEGGSSGSPYFDQNRRIIGQHFGINQTNLAICDRTNRFGGRFDLSWTGGGTNATRLSNWLGANNPPMTLDGIRVPFVNTASDFAVCTTNKQFTLSNSIPGKTITWAVSNPSLFATTGGASTSGTGITATLRAASNSSQGSAVITFTLSQAGCNNVTIIRNIWVGKPLLPTTYPSGSPAIEIGVGQLSHVSLTGTSNTTGAFPFLGHWAAYGAVSVATSNPIAGNTFTGEYEGTGNFSVYTNNSCGNSQTKWGAFNVTGNCNPCPRIIINNPVSHVLQCEIPIDKIPIEYREDIYNLEGDFHLLDNNGNLITAEKFKTNKHSTNVTALIDGMYFVRMIFKENQLTEKVIIIK